MTLEEFISHQRQMLIRFSNTILEQQEQAALGTQLSHDEWQEQWETFVHIEEE